jgi:hypothetical protein
MRHFLILFSCLALIGCISKGGNNMFSSKKTEKILKNKDGQEAIIEIDNLLSPIFYENPEKLTLCEKDIVYIEEFEREVNNGGFSQYFQNDSGNYTEETVNAFKAIGSKIFLNILENAINKFPNSLVPKNNDERNEVLMELESNNENLWTELDNKFYEYEEDIYELLIEYIKKNINDFR